MLRPRGRYGLLLIIALYFMARTQIILATTDEKVIKRSIDLSTAGISNIIKEKETHLEHPHEVLDKPTKFDFDVTQYTEINNENLLQAETGESTTFANNGKKDKEITTISSTSEEKSDQLSKDLLKNENQTISVKCMKAVKSFLRTMSTVDTLQVAETVQIGKKKKIDLKDSLKNLQNLKSTSLLDKNDRFAHDNIVKIKIWNDLISPEDSRTFFSTFGLKKLLLPLFIGAQIIKSILIALFLPSIIGSIGKIVGKGVASFAQSSQNQPQLLEENYEFKDNQGFYTDDYMMRQPLGTLPASAMYDDNMMQTKMPEIASRYSFVYPRLTPMNVLSDRYYTRHLVNPQIKRQDFKVFHEIPTSSLLLTNYDPFYSPLLSRLDAVFSRLGHNSEGCREYAVCAMYRSPARYAPYSNLVSAQLSRDLNELRKPSSDNPDVLRFFRYMKAAKDGQDGLSCEEAYADCESARDDQTVRQNQAMLATYQDIDKLVHARKL